MRIFGFDLGGTPESKSASAADLLREEIFGSAGSKSGPRVNWKTAMQVVPAFACARVIADGLAQVPLKLMQDMGNDKKRVAREHPKNNLLGRRPNSFQTSFDLREQIALHLVFCFNAYIWKNTVGGNIVELLPYEPGSVTVKRSDWDLSYEITTDQGRRIPVAAADMWHIRGPSWNGWEGLDAVRLAREALGLSLAVEEHSARVFSNGALIGGTLTTDGKPNPEERREMRESWQTAYGGLRNAFKTAFLWGGVKYQAMAQQNDAAQLMEQRRFMIEETCRFARVLPIMIGHVDKSSTFASAEQMFLAHAVHTMGPWYARIEQSADANLLTEQEMADGYYFNFFAQGMMRASHKDRAEYYKAALGAGGSPAWMTQDEVRVLDELNPMGGAASTLREPSNVGAPAPAQTDSATGA